MAFLLDTYTDMPEKMRKLTSPQYLSYRELMTQHPWAQSLVQQAVDRMAELGYQNVNSTLFPRMRHEILNERNKAVVYAEILETLDAWNC